MILPCLPPGCFDDISYNFNPKPVKAVQVLFLLKASFSAEVGGDRGGSGIWQP